MATFNLPGATSTVDYLNSKKQDSSFGARSKLFVEGGLDKRLGAFTGSNSQNLALLDYLKTKDTAAPVAATPASNIVTSAKTTTPSVSPSAPFSFAAVPPTAKGPVDFSKVSVSQKNSVPDLLKTSTPGPVDFTKLSVTPPAQPASPATAALQTIAPSTPAPSGAGDAAPTQQTTDAITYESIYPGATSSGERDLVNEFLTSQEGQLLLSKKELGELTESQASEESKRILEEKYAGDRATLENNLAKAGLAFSGIRNTQLKALADSLAASELNLDRKLASKLLESNNTLQEGILKGVEELIKAAASKDDAAHKEAIQQLNAVGLAVVGGKLVQTQAAKNAEAAERNRIADNARADAQYALSERRLQLSEEAAQRAETRFLQLYGEEKRDVFNYATQLFELNPDATTAELRAALLQNNPKASSAEIDAAMALQGVPKALQPTLVGALVANSFTSPGVFSRLKPGDQTEAALTKAREAAKKALRSTGGVLSVDKGGKASTYNVTSDQLNTLINMVDTISLEDVKTLKSAMDADKKK